MGSRTGRTVPSFQCSALLINSLSGSQFSHVENGSSYNLHGVKQSIQVKWHYYNYHCVVWLVLSLYISASLSIWDELPKRS